MAMLQVICKDCHEESSLRGWIEKEDLIGTKYENLMNTITEDELYILQEKGEIKDEWDRWDGKCPECGSELEFCWLEQHSTIHRILKNGKLSKTVKERRYEGSMDCGFIACSNKDCDFHTDCDLDTESRVNGNKIYIHENDNHQFMIDIDE